MEIGKFNLLKIDRSTSVGLYLVDEEGNDVLLPNKYCPENAEPFMEISVFLYRDSEDRLIATNLIPKIELNDFAYLTVVDVDRNGAFLDWGLEKHLFVPFREQNKKMVKGNKYLVTMYLDEQTERLVASARLNRFLDNSNTGLKVGESVDLIVWEQTALGVNVIINKKHKGLIYHNEIFTELYPGMKTKGYIKALREDDKIDVSLQLQGFRNIEDSSAKVLDLLEKHRGFLAFTDHSDPDEIADFFQMSKKSFKRAIGLLYKERKIMIEEEGIRLIKED